MEASMERLLALIDDVYKYVDDVVEKRVVPDINIGRFVADTLSSLPKMAAPAFDKLVNDSLQDQLLLLYLSSIARTQLSIAEKLNTAAQALDSDRKGVCSHCSQELQWKWPREEPPRLDSGVGLQKDDQLVETDPILKKVEEKGTNSGSKSSVAVPKKKNGGFGGLFAKN
ncbi:hypothetical protein Ancab_011457 [Ancistrocladus abbreviatus]